MVIASFKGALILPLALLAALLTRRTSSSVISLLLAVGIVATVLSPVVDHFLPVKVLHWPWLELTGAFSNEVPRFLEYDLARPLPARPEAMVYEESQKLSVAGLVMLVWGLGGLVCLAVRVWKFLNVQLRYSKSEPLSRVGHTVVQVLQKMVQKVGVARVPWLLVNDSISGAQTSGILNPAILVPADFEKLDEEEQEMILCHELAHIQRWDVLGRLTLELMVIVFWFHPLMWWALRRYHEETEMACDDAVLEAGFPASRYSELLLGEFRMGGVVGSRKALRRRITAILRASKHRQPMRGKSALCFTVLIMALLLPLAAITISPYPQSVAFEPYRTNGELKALWRMNQLRGSILPDWSGQGYHGKIHGAQWTVDAERGACLEFDGQDDYLALRAPDVSMGNQPFTLCVWLKPARDSDGGGILLKGDLNGIWSSAFGNTKSPDGGLISFAEREITLAGAARDSSVESLRRYAPGLFPTVNFYDLASHVAQSKLELERWTHLAIVSKTNKETGGIETEHYLNGKSVSVTRKYSAQVEGTLDWPTQVWFFARGESPLSANNHYEGRAADLAIYQKALNAEQIQRVMEGDFPVAQ